MKWLKIIGGIVLLLVLLLAAVPFFITLDDYIPRIEQEVSARLKEPVKIGSLRAAGLPLPHVTVSGITVGKTQDIRVGKVSVTPDLWSLMGDTKVIKSIEVDGLVVTQNALDRMAALIPPAPKAGAPAQPPAVRVESIKLDDAVIKLVKATLGPLDARLNLSSGGGLVDASIVNRDGKLKAHVKPSRSGYVIEAHAKGWTVPLGAPLHFDELVVKGTATPEGADLGDIRARFYGCACA